jgi:dihydroxyacetone kinase-like predicted kinase
MRRETIEIDERLGKEYAGKYVFQEITWAKRNRILQKYTKYNPQTGSVVTTDYVAIQAETILASLKQQPESKPMTLEKLLSEDEDGVPIELGELLSKIVNKLNAVSVEETKNS